MPKNSIQNQSISELETSESFGNDVVPNHSLSSVCEVNTSSLLTEEQFKEPVGAEDEVAAECANKLEKKEDWLDILGSGGILKKVIVEGKSETKPTRNDKCTINYTCSLEDGTVADSGSQFELFLGESDVIPGLDVSIALLNVGERCLLQIEPRLAFGVKGLPPKIPPNAVVLYDVELVCVEPEDEIENLTISQRINTGNKKRERGNWWYTRGDNNLAIQCYRRALNYLDEVEGSSILERGDKPQVSDSDLQDLLEYRINVYNNMAAAQIKMEMYDAALNSLQSVLRCQPNNLKAHFRKAKAYFGKNDMNMAMKCLLRSKEIAPDDPEVQKEINNVEQIIKKQRATERELARRMFSGSNPISRGDENRNKHQNSRRKVGIWATMGALVAVGIAYLVAHHVKYS